MARKKTLEQRLIELIVEHGITRVESALRMYQAATGTLNGAAKEPKRKAKAATQAGDTNAGGGFNAIS